MEVELAGHHGPICDECVDMVNLAVRIGNDRRGNVVRICLSCLRAAVVLAEPAEGPDS